MIMLSQFLYSLFSFPTILLILRQYWWIILIAITIEVILMTVYVVCYQGAKTGNRYKLIPFIILKVLCLLGLIGVVVYLAYIFISSNQTTYQFTQRKMFNDYGYASIESLVIKASSVLAILFFIVADAYFLIDTIKFYREYNTSRPTPLPQDQVETEVMPASTALQMKNNIPPPRYQSSACRFV